MNPQSITDIIRQKKEENPDSYVDECASILATALRNSKWLRSNASDAAKIYDIMYNDELLSKATWNLLITPSEVKTNILMEDVDFFDAKVMGDNTTTACCCCCSGGGSKRQPV